jgi:hypothetical protein
VSAFTADDLCDDSLAYVITNARYSAAPDVYAHIQETQGVVNCRLSPMPLFGEKPETNLHAPAYSPLCHARKAEFFFQNLECVLYAGDSHAEEQVARFADAARQISQLPLSREG